MQAVEIIIHRCNNPERTKSSVIPEDIVNYEGQLLNVTILEQGTSGGNAAIVFTMHSNDGYSFFQLTEGNFNGIVASLKGAKEHWQENPVESIYKK